MRLRSFISTYTGVLDEDSDTDRAPDAQTVEARKIIAKGLAKWRSRHENVAFNNIGTGKVELFDPPLGGKRPRKRKHLNAEDADVLIKVKARKNPGRIIKVRKKQSPQGIAKGLATEQTGSFINVEVQDAASGQWLPVSMTQNNQAMISKALQQAKLVYRDKRVRARDAISGRVFDIVD